MATRRRRKGVADGGVSPGAHEAALLAVTPLGDEAAVVRTMPGAPPGVRFVSVPSARQVLVARTDEDEQSARAGSLVKLRPRLRRSELQAYDGSARRRALLGRGAAAVVVDPEVMPDLASSGEPAEQDASLDPRAVVRGYFEALPAGGERDRAVSAAALELCLAEMERVGL
jgi:hypothetical protein